MSKKAYMRHDISDKVWGLLEPLLPGRRGSWGGVAIDNRRFINAIIWILRTGPHGEIYRHHMEIGKIRTDAFVVGEIKGYGNQC